VSRGWWQSLVVVLLVGGAGCLAWEVAGEGRWERLPSAAEHWPLVFVGGVLWFLAGVSGLYGMVAGGRAVGRLCEAVAGIGSARKARVAGGWGERRGDPSLGWVPEWGRDLAPLVESLNEVLGTAQQRVEDSALKVKELEIQLKVATAERQHAEAILYSISDAVLVTDPFDELVLANESAAKAFDFDLSDAMRLPVRQLLRDPKMIELIQDMRQSSAGGGPGGGAGRRVVEHRLRTPMGERVYKITLSSVASHGSGLSVQGSDASAESIEPPGPRPGAGGVVAVLHDMTREKEVAQIKNDFVSHVSHELRTPLASIKAYVEMLIDGEADDEKTQREFLEVIQNEANRLNRLIDNILNISRIESGLVQIQMQAVSLVGIVADAVEVIQAQARMKRIRVDQQLTPAFYQVMADRDMLYQAVMNLLSNAIKYTPEGGAVAVLTEVDEASRKVVVRIRDTGVGIPPKDLPYVFDKFYRAESNNRVAKGTGLGLSLAKQIVEGVHQGRMWVESEVGKGSCFSFELEVCE
jgi:two-component system, OmpR family, phosphate regulon sensor histidine kinase PhoR